MFCVLFQIWRDPHFYHEISNFISEEFSIGSALMEYCQNIHYLRKYMVALNLEHSAQLNVEQHVQQMAAISFTAFSSSKGSMKV